MGRGGWILLVMLALPAAAEDVPFQGHVLEVDAGLEARPIVRMTSPLYEVRGTAAEIVERAQACAASQKGVAITASDAAAGSVAGMLQADARSMFSSRSMRAKLVLQARDGRFQIVLSELGQAGSAGADTPAGDYAPLGQATSGWDKLLGAAIETQKGIVDCLYR